jgi:monoamine oxidase
MEIDSINVDWYFERSTTQFDSLGTLTHIATAAAKECKREVVMKQNNIEFQRAKCD